MVVMFCDPILLKGDDHACGNACGCQRAHGVARVSTSFWDEEHQRLSLCAPDVAALVARGLLTGVRGSRSFGATHHGFHVVLATNKIAHPFINFGTRPRRHSLTPRWAHMVLSDACM